MLDGFKNLDSPIEKKLTYHPDLPSFAWARGLHKTKTKTIMQQVPGNLVLIIFYHLIRVEEHTRKS